MKKYIHCIVNNDKDISPFSRKCLDSFKDYLTDYEIRYWTVDDMAVFLLPKVTSSRVFS